MRVLFVSNYFPPCHIGGYEIGCHDVAQELIRRGHQVNVLTNSNCNNKPKNQDYVIRQLHTNLRWKTKNYYLHLCLTTWKEVNNQHIMKQAIKNFQPEIVYFWNIKHISYSLINIAERLGIPFAFFVSDSTMAELDYGLDPWHRLISNRGFTSTTRQAKRLLRSLSKMLSIEEAIPPSSDQHADFVSAYLKCVSDRSERKLKSTEIIPWGIDTERFPYRSILEDNLDENCQILFVGQILPHKGVATAIKALGILQAESKEIDFSLDLYGDARDKEFLGKLEKLIMSTNTTPSVHFKGFVNRDELPSVYHTYDILIFPSEWEEPFSITLLEAMSSGIPVVCTSTGGTGEIVRNMQNALVFQTGDEVDCANKILKLARSRQLRMSVARNARDIVESKHRFGEMVDSIEESLSTSLFSSKGQSLDL